MITTRQFFTVTNHGEQCIGQDLDGQGLSADKALANHHGLPIRIKLGYEVVKVILPDAAEVDHVQWPHDAYRMPADAADTDETKRP